MWRRAQHIVPVRLASRERPLWLEVLDLIPHASNLTPQTSFPCPTQRPHVQDAAVPGVGRRGRGGGRGRSDGGTQPFGRWAAAVHTSGPQKARTGQGIMLKRLLFMDLGPAAARKIFWRGPLCPYFQDSESKRLEGKATMIGQGEYHHPATGNQKPETLPLFSPTSCIRHSTCSILHTKYSRSPFPLPPNYPTLRFRGTT